MYVEKESQPGKLKESDLAKFEKKCDTLSQICDTIGLIVKEDAETMTDFKEEVKMQSAPK